MVDGSSRTKRFRSFLQLAAIATIGLATRASFADHYVVPTGSMEPTVHVGDHILVTKAAYGLRIPLTDQWLTTFGGPARGDVVVLDAPPPDAPIVLLKRVVAVGGDRVEVRSGHVFLDGTAVDEPTVNISGDDLGAGGPDYGPTLVPPGKLLVLGDNRGNSRDGRTFGLVDTTRVLGRAVAVIGRDGKPAYEPLR